MEFERRRNTKKKWRRRQSCTTRASREVGINVEMTGEKGTCRGGADGSQRGEGASSGTQQVGRSRTEWPSRIQGSKKKRERERERERTTADGCVHVCVRRGSGTEPKRAFLSDFSLRACSRDHISSRAYAASFISHVSRLEGSSFLTYGPWNIATARLSFRLPTLPGDVDDRVTVTDDKCK